MKKITIGFFLLFALCTVTKAQDAKKVRTFFTLAQLPGAPLQKLVDAKTELDKLLTDPKLANTADVQALKVEIYGSIAGNDSLKARYPNADLEALTALKKYLELDPTEKIFKDDGYRGINPIYASLFNSGLKLYNEKNWDSSFNKFKQVIELSDILIARKWSNTSFDTTAYLYAGVTAQNGNKQEEAVKFYKALADKKLKGENYQGVYEYIVRHYLNHPNPTEFQKYFDLGVELYPTNDLWQPIRFLNLTQGKSVESVVSIFNDEDKNSKLSATDYVRFGDFFSSDSSVKILDENKRFEISKKAQYSYDKAYRMDTSNVIALYNSSLMYFNQFQVTADEALKIKGITPEIKAKRAQADQAANLSADKAIELLEKSYTALEAKPKKNKTEEQSRKSSAKFLAILYEYKREKSKGKAPADYDKYDKKFKFYDSKY